MTRNQEDYRYRFEDDYTSENARSQHNLYSQNMNNQMRESLSERTSVKNYTCCSITLNVAMFIASLCILFKYKDTDCSNKLQNVVIIETVFIGISLLINGIFYKTGINASNINQYPITNIFVKFLLFCGFVWFIVLQTIYFKETCDSNFRHIIIAYIVFGYIAYTTYALNILLLLVCTVIICCNPALRIQLLRAIVPKNNGIKKEKLDTLPMIIFDTNTTTIAKEDRSCAICISDYQNNDELRKFNCDHFFHKICVDEWLIINSTCPLCRKDVKDSEDKNNSNIPDIV